MTNYWSGAVAAWLLLTASEALAAPRTLRLDYYHTGNAKQELFSVDRVVIEPLEWPGNPEKSIDSTNLGKYFFEVKDAKGRVLYSRGFASIYGEWETTDEAQTMNRTFHESVRFPVPDGPVKVVIRKRDELNQFQDVWTANVDPKRHVRRHIVAAVAGRAHRDRKERRAGEQGGCSASRRRIHSGRARQVRARCPAHDRDPVRHFPLQGAATRLQRLGTRTGGGRIRASRVRRPACTCVADRRHLRCFRLRALRADVRQPGVARGRRIRALRVRRDPDEFANLWWRRHLQSLQHGRGRQRAGALRLRARVRPSLRGAGGRVLHLTGRLRARAGHADRTVGAERHSAARSQRS